MTTQANTAAATAAATATATATAANVPGAGAGAGTATAAATGTAAAAAAPTSAGEVQGRAHQRRRGARGVIRSTLGAWAALACAVCLAGCMRAPEGSPAAPASVMSSATAASSAVDVSSAAEDASAPRRKPLLMLEPCPVAPVDAPICE